MTAASFAVVRLAMVLVADKVFIDKTIVQAFEKLRLLTAANRLAAANLIFIDCCSLNTHYFAHVGFVMIFTVNAIDCWILYAKQTMLFFLL